MDYRVILSRPALRDLGEIARYIALHNPTAAERVGLELVQLAESLAVMPRRGGQFRAGRKNGVMSRIANSLSIATPKLGVAGACARGRPPVACDERSRFSHGAKITSGVCGGRDMTPFRLPPAYSEFLNDSLPHHPREA